jgi:outer membrane protein insertion porin family
MYKIEKIHVYNIKDDASNYIKEQEGNKLTSALSFTFTMDTRDDYFVPTKGERHSLFIQNAGGILGGDNYFIKVQGETSWYFPLPMKTVLNLRGKAGMIEPYGGKKAPIYEKFFVGGLQTMRGFEFGMVGPVDQNKEPLGSKKMLVMNTEWIFPLATEIGLRGALFWDIGNGFDKYSDLFPLRMGMGVGIRWFSPFGPIHIDMGLNPNPRHGEKRTVIDFAMGGVF